MTARIACRRLLAGLAALGLLAGAAGASLAATPDPMLGSPWPQDTALTYAWASGAVPPSAMKTAVNTAAAEVTSSKRSRAPSFAYSSAASNAVSYGTDNPCGVNGIACFRRDSSSGYWHLWFRENGHRYDWGTLTWCEMAGSPSGCFEAETITLDELGHVSGLDHHVNLPDDSDYLDAVVQTYSHARPQVGWSVNALGRCDIAALQQVYDVPSWTTPYSTCLDIPTTLTLTASPTSASAGAAVTFTASLRSDGTGRLDGNPMSGRTVVLQQRSGSSWADLTTMSAGSNSGSYTVSLALKGSQDFRAVFRKPSSEGVRAASSAAISISVGCTSAPCPLVVGGAR
ncbi:MAG: hypothetical protein U0838_10415 [Chloroflexota bacterium]